MGKRQPSGSRPPMRLVTATAARRTIGARCRARRRTGGPLTETAATGRAAESKTGAATHALPRTASSLS